jgi:AAA15 family ATPase/GTPase
MLLKLSFENLLSFKDKNIFNMSAGKGLKFDGRLLHYENYAKHVLPAGSVYGGDPKGLDSFSLALRFFKRIATEAPPFINSLNLYSYQNFTDGGKHPTRLAAQFLAGGQVYRYSFTAFKDVVYSEKLSKVFGQLTERVFERLIRKVRFGKDIETTPEIKETIRTLPRAQLFLSFSRERKFSFLEDVSNWFSDTLQILGQGSYFPKDNPSPDKNYTYSSKFYDFISLQDQNDIKTRIYSREVPKNMPIHQAVKKGELTEVGNFLINVDKKAKKVSVYYLYKSQNDHKLLQIYPYDMDSEWEQFILDRPFASEREKSSFVTNLALADIQSGAGQRLYVFNRLDETFDPIKARTVISSYLDSLTANSHSQVVFTTSNPLLLDKMLFRPDEIWVTEHFPLGVTKLSSLISFRSSIKSKPAWKGVKLNKIGGIYPALLMAALETTQNEPA